MMPIKRSEEEIREQIKLERSKRTEAMRKWAAKNRGLLKEYHTAWMQAKRIKERVIKELAKHPLD